MGYKTESNKQTNKTNEQTHRHRKQYGDYQRGRGLWGENEEVKGGQMYGYARRLNLGGEHTVQYTDDVL